MALEDKITRETLDGQRRLFRLAERDHDLCLKRISLDSGIPYTTIRTYAAGEAMMPVAAINRLADIVPDKLLSHLFTVSGKHLIDVDNDPDHDLDELADEADEVARDVRRARRPDSPGGHNIVPIEREQIVGKAKRLGARAKRVAA
jgi:hypothetical protein